ncbi:MAG: type II toxin-antitoxin system HigB family toxin [Cyclobacteriaceae bacterium]|nr:type II toxin-antitoxin system HigB family toxin [Cyclobacteriaceae bacterium]
MRVIAKSRIRDFWEKHPDAKDALVDWYNLTIKANWESPHQVKDVYPSADHVGNNRTAFNICGNKYRLIVVFRYRIQMVFIRFVGTHTEYDKIKDIKNI